MKLTLALSAVILLASTAAEARIPRSHSAVHAFQATNPCPSTGRARGGCPGYQVDHRAALCAGGLDAPGNMQWLSIAAHAAKTRIDVPRCRLMRQQNEAQ